MKQTSTVQEYITKFEEFMGLVKRDNPFLQDSYFITSFVAGLQEPIQHHLQCHKPTTLTNAFWYARRLEQAHPLVKRQQPFGGTFKPPRVWTKDTKEK